MPFRDSLRPWLKRHQSLDRTLRFLCRHRRKLNDPDFQSERFEEVPAVVAELEATKAEVTRLYARWEELEALP